MRALLHLHIFCVAVTFALKYDPDFVGYNLNTNTTAEDILDYSGAWAGHTYQASPSNWRFPIYTLFLDRYVDGDPANNDINGTAFETDQMSNQFRFGGDILGLQDTLDYIQGMGIRGIYIAGTPWINLPWKADGYSPLDFSLLDEHFGNIQAWRTVIDNIHARGMYVIMDNTVGTMADLIGFDGFLNTTAPFNPREYDVVWKGDRRYPDFDFSNEYSTQCTYPTFYDEMGVPVLEGSNSTFDELQGCFDSDFDQYGAAEPSRIYPDWQLSLSKAGLVQDRLREWIPSVREKLQHFACLMISSLDIDGFRFDKAGQVTVDAFADYSTAVRTCAQAVGKNNFLLTGELSNGNDYASIYLGRGRQPDMLPQNFSQALALTNASSDSFFIRPPGHSPVDAAAFHYSIYRSLQRFLGLDGNLSAMYDIDIDFVSAWNEIVMSNDLTNANTGQFDPRHMLGTTNQDNFRWPAISQGVEKMLLGQYITTLHMPGIPLLLWGEEQAFYITDSTDPSYTYGRQPMSGSLAWQKQGCYNLGSSQYFQFPLQAALKGCQDDLVSLDHRDPTHPVRNIIKAMYHLREKFPTLNDGYYLQTLSKQTHIVSLPGSNGVPTETGMWSVLRDQYSQEQRLTSIEPSGVWLVYQNTNSTAQYSFDCSSSSAALIAPFDEGTTVKNLLAPFDEITLGASSFSLGIDNSTNPNGCISSLTLNAFDFKAYVPKDQWVAQPPMMTSFSPGHDARILSNTSVNATESIQIEFQFSVELDCDQITKNLLITSATGDNTDASIDSSSVSCKAIQSNDLVYIGEIVSAWSWSGKLINVADGVHSLTVQNATSTDGTQFTNSYDKVLLRIGQADNPVVFPRTADYCQEILSTGPVSGNLSVAHKASGADMWRYSTNWASSWSNWQNYTGGLSSVAKQPWSGTKQQEWEGDHIILQYWSSLAGSSAHIQHADIGRSNSPPRRFPHLFAFSNDSTTDFGMKSQFSQSKDGWWGVHKIAEWPTYLQVNVWGVNPDGKIDGTYVMGDIGNNSILNRQLPDSLTQSAVAIKTYPPSPYVAYRLEINDTTLSYRLVPTGSRAIQSTVYALLWFVSPLLGALSVWIYMGAFYGVKFNQSGVASGLKKPFLPFFSNHKFKKIPDYDTSYQPDIALSKVSHLREDSGIDVPKIVVNNASRRTVLIATMEYDIEDWKIKIKIGGLGVMAQLMGKNLPHQDLIWVVPCVGDVEYPVDPDGAAESMYVIVIGKLYEVKVQYHQLRNITYVLLDAPVFRQQTKSEPYPPRMDDIDSAIYYSAWNACIAETIKRFPIDIYHINDYHGAAAPLYLLPDTIPCCLSLHNAEFQGLWPMRSSEERAEVSKVFNLHLDTIQKYVQFGEVFNLLHAGASYLRVHQKGFGAVGVSNKYGDRSYARYPIFWGLKEIGKLPNPDPADTEPWDPEAEARQVITVDPTYEASRGELRRQAQEWAQLEVNPNAELFVFVGRWSVQKGVDLIADVFPAVLEKHRSVQLICIGPVIDMYGKFAALKLGEMMKKYPRRVYSKPEFTALPPFIFTGAEFALIPSRDEPFGLVAVEFGRKGALGVGARVGGLGQMPGWWYTVESTTPKHLQKQFKSAIEKALGSGTGERAMMRAKSAKQRFPVARWVEDLDHLQSQSIKVHQSELRKHGKKGSDTFSLRGSSRPTSMMEPYGGSFGQISRNVSQETLINTSAPPESANMPDTTPFQQSTVPMTLGRTLSLGVRSGPGHVSHRERGEPKQILEVDESDEQAEVTISSDQAEAIVRHDRKTCQIHQACRDLHAESLATPNVTITRDEMHVHGSQSGESSASQSPPLEAHDRVSLSPFPRHSLVPEQVPRRHRNSSVLSVNEVKGEKDDFMLQKVDPTFKDSTGEYYRAFEGMLSGLKGKTSETELCIEEFLVKSEKEWASKMRDVKMGRHQRGNSDGSSIFKTKRESSSGYGVLYTQPIEDNYSDENELTTGDMVGEEFLLPKDYKRPSRVKRWMTIRLLDWPLYSFLLGLGQILAANSYQITLLIPGSGESLVAFYVLGAIYIISTAVWWFLFRRIPSYMVLTVPFVLYGTAFFLIGIASAISVPSTQGQLHYLASGFYITASASGSLYFALNFGDEGGAPITSWVYRACVIQGTQSIYTAALFYWGHFRNQDFYHPSITPIAVSLAIAVLLWVIATIVFTGLPTYYRQSPGKIPNFYRTIVNRKIILWFLVTVALQNFFLSTNYGRNWEFLWASKYAQPWMIAILAMVFLIGVWVAILLVFARLSKDHSWILPMFAVSLGAPRWAQMLWGTSGYGLWLPWVPGGPVAGALAARSVWLWLGMLDAIQGVGFGMMLLQTLTRFHTAASLMAAQILGASVTLIAKACAPDKDGPGDVFPDLSAGVGQAFSKPWFWVSLFCQLVIPIGFIMFFRKEQLSKP